MKRIILLSLVTLLCLPLAVYAASIGGAETLGQNRYSLGLDTEYVFEKDLEYDEGGAWGSLDFNEDYRNMEIESYYKIMAKVSYGLLDNLDVYVKLGMADFEESYDKYEDDEPDEVTSSDARNGFAYGIGFKVTHPLTEEWLIGCDFQYLRHKNKYSYQENDLSDPTESISETGKTKIQEWHIAPFIAKKWGNFTPYLGVRYSDLREKSVRDNVGAKFKLKADDNVGVFLGTDYKLDENWSLNLETRFIDETAISFGGTYKF